jgi:hypothetical protein
MSLLIFLSWVPLFDTGKKLLVLPPKDIPIKIPKTTAIERNRGRFFLFIR